MRCAEVTNVLQSDGRVTNVRVNTPEGVFNVQADQRPLAAPAATPGDPARTGGYVDRGLFLRMRSPGSCWQCAYMLGKGGTAVLQAGAGGISRGRWYGPCRLTRQRLRARIALHSDTGEFASASEV